MKYSDGEIVEIRKKKRLILKRTTEKAPIEVVIKGDCVDYRDDIHSQMFLLQTISDMYNSWRSNLIPNITEVFRSVICGNTAFHSQKN